MNIFMAIISAKTDQSIYYTNAPVTKLISHPHTLIHFLTIRKSIKPFDFNERYQKSKLIYQTMFFYATNLESHQSNIKQQP